MDEPRFEALARERGLSWQDREGFGRDYAETLKRWRERYDQAVARGALTDFERAVPRSLALLSDVLRRRLPRRRNRCCASDHGQDLESHPRPDARARRGPCCDPAAVSFARRAFPPEVTAAAEEAAGRRSPITATEPLCRWSRSIRLSSTDLDQAFVIERRRRRPHPPLCDRRCGKLRRPRRRPIDREAWTRGETIYLPDGKVGLYPPVLSEGAASLLPDGDRPRSCSRSACDRGESTRWTAPSAR